MALDPSQVVKQTYGQQVIEEIDYADIKSLLGEFSYEKCKVILQGNDIFEKQDILPTPIGKQLKEKHFKTIYHLYEKPDNINNSFTTKDWKAAIKNLAQPTKNRFIPEDISVIAVSKKLGRKT